VCTIVCIIALSENVESREPVSPLRIALNNVLITVFTESSVDWAWHAYPARRSVKKNENLRIFCPLINLYAIVCRPKVKCIFHENIEIFTGGSSAGIRACELRQRS